MKQNTIPSEIQKRKLTQDISCSAIGFGGGSISGSAGGYGYGDISESQAVATLEHAYQSGITLFDTAPIYGFGDSEKRIGKALSGQKELRKNMVIVTKLGVTWDSHKNTFIDNSPDSIHRMLEQSLKDLKTDYIDLYMIHWPDNKTPIESTMETLKKYKDAGVIRAIGASNFGVDLIERACQIAPIETLQSEFNVFNNTNAKQLLEICTQRKIGFMAYGSLAKGLLTGKVLPNRKYDLSDVRSKFAFVEKQALALANEAKRFLEIAQELNCSPAELAVTYVLSFPHVSTALCGSKTPEQISSLLHGAKLILPANVKSELDSMADLCTPIYLNAYA